MEVPAVLRDEGAGVALRPWAADDAPALVAAWADPAIAAQATVPVTGDLAAAQAWIGGAAARAAADLSVDLVVDALDPATGRPAGEVRGEVGLARLTVGSGGRRRTEWEVGWWIAAPHRGRGLATAAARLLVRWAQEEAGVGRVVARIARGSTASEAVARHLGLARAGAWDDESDLWVGPGRRRGGV